jgi:hypothetical protein
MKLASSSRPGQRLWSLHLQLTFSLLKMSLKLHFDRSRLNSLLPASTQLNNLSLFDQLPNSAFRIGETSCLDVSTILGLSEKKLFKALKGSLNSQELCV